MSLDEMLAQLDDLTDEERLTLSDAARVGVNERERASMSEADTDSAGSVAQEPDSNAATGTADPDDGPGMSGARYRFLKAKLAEQRQIDHEIWE